MFCCSLNHPGRVSPSGVPAFCLLFLPFFPQLSVNLLHSQGRDLLSRYKGKPCEEKALIRLSFVFFAGTCSGGPCVGQQCFPTPLAAFCSFPPAGKGWGEEEARGMRSSREGYKTFHLQRLKQKASVLLPGREESVSATGGALLS